jgi:hypothetical protein
MGIGMTYIEEKTDIVFPNISVCKRLLDGNICAYIVRADEGFVFYDKAANHVETHEDGTEHPVVYYYTIRMLPKNFDFSKFSLVAMPRKKAPKDYIF